MIVDETPDGWCLRGTTTCAQFFGGATSSDSHYVMWLWSGGGGTFNGSSDHVGTCAGARTENSR